MDGEEGARFLEPYNPLPFHHGDFHPLGPALEIPHKKVRGLIRPLRLSRASENFVFAESTERRVFKR